MELEKFGVNGLTLNEEKEINGGDFGIGIAILIGAAIAASAEIFDDWDNFKAGLSGNKPN